MDQWLKIYEDFYKAVQELDPPEPIKAVMIAMCKKIASLMEERDEIAIITLRSVEERLGKEVALMILQGKVEDASLVLSQSTLISYMRAKLEKAKEAGKNT